jgi:hypothetical protein
LIDQHYYVSTSSNWCNVLIGSSIVNDINFLLKAIASKATILSADKIPGEMAYACSDTLA